MLLTHKVKYYISRSCKILEQKCHQIKWKLFESHIQFKYLFNLKFSGAQDTLIWSCVLFEKQIQFIMCIWSCIVFCTNILNIFLFKTFWDEVAHTLIFWPNSYLQFQRWDQNYIGLSRGCGGEGATPKLMFEVCKLLQCKKQRIQTLKIFHLNYS